MGSLFNKEPDAGPPLSNFEKIESEVEHLKKRASIRQGPGASTRTTLPYLITLAILGLFSLYALDVFRFAWFKSDGIKAYLYLKHYGSDEKLAALAKSGMFTSDEISVMENKTGNFQGYATSPTAAQKTADDIVAYLQSVKDFQDGKYDQLDTMNKIRYTLFIKPGLAVPTQWKALNPEVK